MIDIPDLNALFSLESPLPPPKINPAISASGLEFLRGVHFQKSEALKALLLEHGWHAVVTLDAGAISTTFMIVQHADYDVEFQRYCHGLMLAAAKEGHLALGFLAFLTDRILTNEGHHQRFGTQIREATNGCLVPKPLEDPDAVDELRELAGLGNESLSDYLQRLNDGDEVFYRSLLSDLTQKVAPAKEATIIPFPGTTTQH